MKLGPEPFRGYKQELLGSWGGDGGTQKQLTTKMGLRVNDWSQPVSVPSPVTARELHDLGLVINLLNNGAGDPDAARLDKTTFKVVSTASVPGM